jgi:glutamate formiminotransferase/formiminotetrahydrofolate cyclodeaminase
MPRLIECVPNFSEGRKRETIERIAHAIESVVGAIVLDIHMDVDHNRSVITFVAAPEAVVEAAWHAVACAMELIDIRAHKGEHPRVGATDVLPFIPVRDVTMEECVALAHHAGTRIADELNIPVYFYERAALRADRANLEDVRRGGFELLREEIASVPARAPDLGPARLHETAGAIIVGARPFLIAYNINLQTTDLSIAWKIARAVRARDGGLPFLKALGFKLESRGSVQVSMNLVDYEKTPLHQAFEAVRREATRHGVMLEGSEIVGLVPQKALDHAAEYFLQIENFSSDAVLENRINAALVRHNEKQVATDFVEELARNEPTPGGGAAAAHAASLSAALGEMIARLTIGKEKYAQVEVEMNEALAELIELRKRLMRAVSSDAANFARVLEARRMNKTNEDERRVRASSIEGALKAATLVLLEVAELTVRVLQLLETLASVGNANTLSDAATGAQLGLAAIASARYNVLVNIASLEDKEFAAEHRARADDLLSGARFSASQIEAMLMDSLRKS